MRHYNIPCCEECSFYENEGANGCGFCAIMEQGRWCDDVCELQHTKMKPKQIAKGLHYIQKWRRGSDIPMPHPYVVGKVNDAAIYQLRKQERERREMEEMSKIKRGDLVLLRGEYKGTVKWVHTLDKDTLLIEFDKFINGHVQRYVVNVEDVKILFRKVK